MTHASDGHPVKIDDVVPEQRDSVSEDVRDEQEDVREGTSEDEHDAVIEVLPEDVHEDLPEDVHDAVIESGGPDVPADDRERWDEEAVAVPEGPGEAAVHTLIENGPQGPQGRVEMAAAGIDVDQRYPMDPAYADADDHADESPETSRRLATAATSAIGEPLLVSAAEMSFLDRWQAIQIGFVEDPSQSVQSADTLLGDIADAYDAAFKERRARLTATWRQGNPGTEELRQTLQQYRSLMGVVLPK